MVAVKGPCSDSQHIRGNNDGEEEAAINSLSHSSPNVKKTKQNHLLCKEPLTNQQSRVLMANHACHGDRRVSRKKGLNEAESVSAYTHT